MIATALLIAVSGFDNHMGDWSAGWWILMAFMMVAFWGLVIVGVVWLIRALMAERHGHGGANPSKCSMGAWPAARYRPRNTASGARCF
jgi:hypothetical protein